jgi:hypothetical protein
MSYKRDHTRLDAAIVEAVNMLIRQVTPSEVAWEIHEKHPDVPVSASMVGRRARVLSKEKKVTVRIFWDMVTIGPALVVGRESRPSSSSPEGNAVGIKLFSDGPANSQPIEYPTNIADLNNCCLNGPHHGRKCEQCPAGSGGSQ